MLQRTTLGGGKIDIEDESVRLILPPTPPDTYALAQFDDYHDLPRDRFPHTPIRRATWYAQTSQPTFSGSAGFGFWNDPFGNEPVPPQGIWLTCAAGGVLTVMAGHGSGEIESLALPDLILTAWQRYTLEWNSVEAWLSVNSVERWRTTAPPGPLGFVIWLSNRVMTPTTPIGVASPYREISVAEYLEVKSLKIERLG